MGETRVTAVYGVPMTRGNTPREAAQAWLALYGSIFDDGATFGAPNLRDFSEFKLKNGRTVFAYKQKIDDLEVEGSIGRIMVYDGPPAQVVYVSANVAKRPAGGLPAARISAASARTTAQQHPIGLRLTRWGEPEMVAMVDATRGREAVRVWKVVASGGRESYTFRIDAVTGEVVDYYSNSLQAFADEVVSGYVLGNATLGLASDTTPVTPIPNCENLPVLQVLPYARVDGFESGTSNLLATTYTDENGFYTLSFPAGTGAVDVVASLNGPAWEVFTVDGDPVFVPFPGPGICPTRDTPVTGSVTVTPPLSPVTLVLNPTKAERTNAQVNAHLHLYNSWQHFEDFLAPSHPPVPGLNDVIEIDVNFKVIGAGCNAAYRRDGAISCRPVPVLAFFEKPETLTCLNTASSTIVAHEYGHYLLDKMLGIVPSRKNPPRGGFHEGWSDTVAFMVFNTDTIALNNGDPPNGVICNTYWRQPLTLEPKAVSPHCSGDGHDRGELLGAIWLELLFNSTMPLADVRELHFNWSLIAQAPGDRGECSIDKDSSADVVTLIEVLTADDDDGNFATGTPNCLDILDAFADHDITLAGIDIGLVCGGDFAGVAGPECTADLDTSTGRGVLDVFDYVEFQRMFTRGDSGACDLDTSNGPGICNIFDFIEFQASFGRGCK